MKTTAKEKREEKAHATEVLKEYFEKHEKPQVYTGLKSVSANGMARRIRCYVVRDGEIWDITYFVSKVIAWSLNDKGILAQGCGMDMGFHLVNTLNSVLYWNTETKTFTKELQQRWL